MATLKSVLRIFLSSPGDVGQERDVVRRAIYAAGHDPLISNMVSFDCVAWDHATANVPLSINRTPQESVNEYVVRPRDCDLTIVILWSRLGTPLPLDIKRSDGSRFESGTAWELEDAVNNGKPVWLYQKITTPKVDLNDDQLAAKLDQYKATVNYIARSRASDGSLTYGVNKFENDEQLHDLVVQHLRYFVKSFGAVSAAATHVQSIERFRIEREPVAETLGIVDQAVAAAVLATASKGEPLTSVTSRLFRLERYPIGPMLRDVQVLSIAESVADLLYGEDVRPIFSSLNSSLKDAAKKDDPALRVPLAQFSTAVGSKNFWVDVFHYCAIQGPRALAALLSQFGIERFDGDALKELRTLIERVNHYVE